MGRNTLQLKITSKYNISINDYILRSCQILFKNVYVYIFKKFEEKIKQLYIRYGHEKHFSMLNIFKVILQTKNNN